MIKKVMLWGRIVPLGEVVCVMGNNTSGLGDCVDLGSIMEEDIRGKVRGEDKGIDEVGMVVVTKRQVE